MDVVVRKCDHPQDPSSTNAPSLQRSSLLRDDANDGTIELGDEYLHQILRNLLAFRGISSS
jgi:hypothetical protein